MNGEPKYGPEFTHFDYVNPDAPKGGTAGLSAVGTFDSFNGFIAKGVAAQGLGLIYDTLTVKSSDEPFTQYGLLAESIEWPEDRSWVIFHLDPRARFHDGSPVTAHDVVFTFKALVEKGDPSYQKYYRDVSKAAALDERRVRFDFSSTTNRELPLIVAQLPVLPEAYWQGRDFSATTLEPPRGGGPYRIGSFQAGRDIAYERVPDYWAKDHPVNKGRFNFDTVRYDYFRDATVDLHAFKSGAYDFRQENNSKEWATAYDGPPFRDGMITAEMIDNDIPQGMQGFVFNLRREKFADPLVREAIILAFDFDWANANLFYGQYTRSESYFSNSELGSEGTPDAAELALLEPYRDVLPPETFTREYQAPRTDGSGNNRANLRRAMELLKQAGWEVRGNTLKKQGSEETLSFEMLLYSPAFERIVLPFKRNLERLGIEMSVRMVDISQYINRLRSFDYDMVVATFPQSASPGNEQRNYWSSEAAAVPGSNNLIGIRNRAVDGLVEEVVSARSREDLITACRALDRALLWGHYLVPNWHLSAFRVAYWNLFGRPATVPEYDLEFFSWWIDPEREQAVRRYQQRSD